ncbi:hypothetical protein DPSP01_003349 [Paraphaeosphaeria sporulosa]
MRLIRDCLRKTQGKHINNTLLGSKTLYTETLNVVLKRCPISDFGRGLGRKILRVNLASFLKIRVRQYRLGKLEPMKSWRTKKLEREPYFLPDYITRVLHRIEEISGERIRDDVRIERESILCDVMVYHHGQSDWANNAKMTGQICSEQDFLRLLTQDRNSATNRNLIKKWEETFPQACIGALAAIGHYEVLQVVLSPSKCEMWNNSYAFPYAFCAAAFAGQHSVIDEILDVLKDSLALEDISPHALIGGAACALKNGKLDIARDILELGDDFLPVVASKTFPAFLAEALASDDASFMSLVLDMAHDDNRRCYIDAFANACMNGQVTIAGLFFEKNKLNINQNFEAAGLVEWPVLEHVNPILTAITQAPSSKARAALVGELLRLGASPDGPRIMNRGFWSLPVPAAVRIGCQDTVLVLLNNGADLMLSNNPKYKLEKMRVLRWISARFQHGLQYLIKPSVRQELRNQLGSGPEPDRKEPNPFLMLAVSVKDYRWDAVRLLLNRGANLRFRPADWYCLAAWDDILKAMHAYFSDGRRDFLSDVAWWRLNNELGYMSEIAKAAHDLASTITG